MKVTLNWLKEYVAFDWTPEELQERLTMLGLEVEGMERVGGGFEGIVVGEVVTRDKHPNADKLSLCQVRDGEGARQIVCGARNFEAGDKVALILPGASLPAAPGEKPFTIKVGKIRGVESCGMMCSPKELGLAEDADGILILPREAEVGQPLARHLGRDETDVVYDLEVTPNRPDLNSVIGIAREISAVTGHPLRLPDPGLAGGAVQVAAAGGQASIDRQVAVRIEDEELCPRYTARLVRGVKVGPSPNWLRNTLEKVGIRSISNVVDATNYVMLEAGQPLHAFDYHLIAADSGGKPTLIIRRARAQETFQTLDETGHELSPDQLLIADSEKGIALAGVMGGLNTEINDQTVDVLIESAYFKPQNIRATSKKLELRTESSYRFERGCDVGIVDWASRRAAQLILETAGGSLVPGVVDVHPHPQEPGTITLRHEKTSRLLGVDISAEDQVRHLASLGMDVLESSEDKKVSTVRVPSFRVDLKRETDLIEEVARLYGVDRIPSTPPRGALGQNAFDAVHDQISEIRRVLAGLGLNETQGQTLISDASAALVAAEEETVPLAHPLSSDMNVLRPSLLPGLLDALRHNLAHRNNEVALFEVGRVFGRTGESPTPAEKLRVALMVSGLRQPLFWSGSERDALYDAADLKGILEKFLEHTGMRGVSYQTCAAEEAGSLYVESGMVWSGKEKLGELGQLVPALAKRYEARAPVFLAELDLDLLLARRNPAKSYKPIPSFPSVRRDVAMFVSEQTSHESIMRTMRQARPENLERVDLFDIFRGKNVPEGQKSMAYALIYRHKERTLKDEEVNRSHEKVLKQLREKLQANLRGSDV